MTPDIQADLTLEVGGEVHRVHGEGQTLTWSAPDARHLVDGSSGPLERRQLARFADGLAAAGIVVELRDGDGAVATLGRRQRSLLGQLLYGSEAVQVHRRLLLLRSPAAKPLLRGAGVVAAVAAISLIARRLLDR